jgi:integrase
VDKILKVAKRLKTFSIEDIIMFCDIDADTARKFLQESENIKSCGDKFEYVETIKAEDKFKIIDKNIPSKNLDITVVEACEIFLEIKQNTLTEMSFQVYKTFVYSKIIPYFMKFRLKDITIQDILNFRKYLQNNKVSERRIKNILALLNQIIKYFQNEGYIDKTCIFEVKRIADIPKRQIQILTPEQLAQLFKILKKKYPYMLSIVQNLITLKQPLNTILTGDEQQKKFLKRKIRKDFYKVKKELRLSNYMFNDLLFCSYI